MNTTTETKTSQIEEILETLLRDISSAEECRDHWKSKVMQLGLWSEDGFVLHELIDLIHSNQIDSISKFVDPVFINKTKNIEGQKHLIERLTSQLISNDEGLQHQIDQTRSEVLERRYSIEYEHETLVSEVDGLIETIQDKFRESYPESSGTIDVDVLSWEIKDKLDIEYDINKDFDFC